MEQSTRIALMLLSGSVPSENRHTPETQKRRLASQGEASLEAKVDRLTPLIEAVAKGLRSSRHQVVKEAGDAKPGPPTEIRTLSEILGLKRSE